MRDLIGAVMSHDHALHVTTQELKLCSYELHTYVGRYNGRAVCNDAYYGSVILTQHTKRLVH